MWVNSGTLLIRENDIDNWFTCEANTLPPPYWKSETQHLRIVSVPCLANRISSRRSLEWATVRAGSPRHHLRGSSPSPASCRGLPAFESRMADRPWFSVVSRLGKCQTWEWCGSGWKRWWVSRVSICAIYTVCVLSCFDLMLVFRMFAWAWSSAFYWHFSFYVDDVFSDIWMYKWTHSWIFFSDFFRPLFQHVFRISCFVCIIFFMKVFAWSLCARRAA